MNNEENQNTIFSSNKDSEARTKAKSNLPLLVGGDENLAAWVAQDNNGNYYLSMELPLGLGSVPVFVNDIFKDSFNQMIEYLIDKGELDREAIN